MVMECLLSYLLLTKGEKMAQDNMSFSEFISPFNFSNYKEKFSFIASVLLYPALTVMVFLRYRIGYRTLSPHRFIIMATIIYLLPNSTEYTPPDVAMLNKTIGLLDSVQGNHFLLSVYVLSMLALCFIQRRLRWVEFSSGKLWHSYSTGISWFEFLPLPDHVVRRFIDPIVCYIIGSIIYGYFPYLGWWLEVSAFCLLGREGWQYQMEINSLLDLQDSLCESEVQSQNVAMFSDEQNAGTRNNRSIEETAGIQTGLAPDIEAHLMRRRNRKPPPDDLAE